MQEELLQFKLQKVWTLVDLPNGKRAIGAKWVFRNKKDDRGIVVRNKARLVAQGYTQEEGIDYDEVFALVAKIEAIKLFLAYASFMGFIVYQMDVKSAFLYAPRAWYETLSTYLLENGFRRGTVNKTLFIKKEKDDAQEIPDDSMGSLLLLRLQVKAERFDESSSPRQDEEVEDVDVHLYRSMIGSLMYLTAFRPDIMFDVCAWARFQVTPKVSHLNAVKRIFRYLKGQPKLGLWYPRYSPFDLKAFFDSDYAGSSLDKKSTTGGCQFLGKRLISWQCKKQSIVANSITESMALMLAVFNYLDCKKLEWDDDSETRKWVNNVTTAGPKAVVSAAEGNGENVVKSSTCWIWRPTGNVIDHTSKDSGSYMIKRFDYVDLQGRLNSKSTSWNEFSTIIASAVICLANGQKFNFSKLIFDELFNDVYQTPAHTKKVFTNMKRKGTDFSRRVTPLFASMLAPPVVEGEGSGQPSEPQPATSTAQPRIEEQILVTESSSPQNTQSPRQTLQDDTQFPQTSMLIPNVADEAVFKEWDDRVVPKSHGGVIAQTRSERASKHSYDSPLPGGNTPGSDEERIEQDDLMDFVPPIPHDSPLSGGHTPGSDDGRPNINELMTIYTYLLNRVLALEQSKTAQDLVIRKLKKKV
ncbi:putative ribonuclease H-like domain-containing protein [Tanacetum coccineum]